ncbi:MAG: GntR family transcriptional regulator [Sphaerochaeta sp.]|nr:GntR family transcriptional regulator [Sphaerochaeta sp.]
MSLKFKNVFTELQMKIITGEWSEGYRIPTEMELCDQFKVSRVTVRRALDGLVSFGYITRTRGRGSFVLFNRAVVGLGYPQRPVAEEGIWSSGMYKLLLMEKLHASATDRKQLRLDEKNSENRIWHLKSIHLVNGQPSVLSDYYISEKYGDYLVDVGDTSEKSFFELISQKAGQNCHLVQGRVAAINPNDEICRQLGVNSHSASLWCRGLCVLDDGTIVGRCSKVFNSLFYEFSID